MTEEGCPYSGSAQTVKRRLSVVVAPSTGTNWPNRHLLVMGYK